MKYFLAALIILITLPLVAQAEVRINEIAWMGVTGTNGSFGEWFELYNSSDEAVNVNGWVLYKDEASTKKVIALSGSIPAGGYFVVERTTGSMPDPLPGIGDQSGAFSHSGFNNENGEYLVLKDLSGAVVQKINATPSWPAGNSATKETMQWSGGSWITAAPTPRATNATQESSGMEHDEPERGNNNSDTVVTKKKEDRVRSLSKLYPKNNPHIALTLPGVVYSGVEYEYTGLVALEHSNPTKGNFVWNMGDGTIVKTETLSSLRHSYRYPGVYTMTLAYHFAPEYFKPLVQTSAVVTVAPPRIELSMLNSTTLVLKNTDETSIDISGWQLHTPEGYGEFPMFTILAPRGNMAIPIERLGFTTLSSAILKTSGGSEMAVLGSAQKTQIVRSRSARTLPLPSISYAQADSSLEEETDLVVEETAPQTRQHRTVVIGAVVIIGVLSLLLLERVIARSE
ncbi:MAG TPA: lamin tail domain-containing protein [Candidatus Paceibacterota bacterium]